MAKLRKLNMGYIGMGFIGPVHAAAIALGGCGVPYAVADDDPAKRKEAKELGYKIYSSAEAMINDPDVHAVHITGPDKFHADWAIQAMKAKKKVVVCEKPMTETLDDALQVLAAAERFEAEGGVFMTNINYMGHALPRAVREERQKGKFGKIAFYKEVYEQDWLMGNIWNWRLEGDQCASKDILPHLISGAYFMGGMWPTGLVAHSKTIVDERQKPISGRGDAFKDKGDRTQAKMETVKVHSDLYSSVLCDMINAEGDVAAGNFMVTQYFKGKKNYWDIDIAGSDASISWNQTRPNELWIGGDTLNHILINDPKILKDLGFVDAPQYSSYPAEHPGGHIDAFACNFKVAYGVALGKIPRINAVIPGAMIGYVCVAVGDAVKRSQQIARLNDGIPEWVKVNYKGVNPHGRL